MEIAGQLDSIRERVAEEVGYMPTRTVDIVVMDPYRDSNGFALPFVRKARMGVFATPPPSPRLYAPEAVRSSPPTVVAASPEARPIRPPTLVAAQPRPLCPAPPSATDRSPPSPRKDTGRP